MSDFYPIELQCQNYEQYPMVDTYNQFIVPNYQYVGKYDYRKVVDPKRNAIWVIYPVNERSEDNYFLCLISPYESTYTYYLGIIDMKTNICYYLRYDENSKISYYEDINFIQHQIDIYDNIPINHEYDYYGSDCYIVVDETWVSKFISKTCYSVIKLGDYRICNARALSPTNAKALSPVEIPVATVVIQEEIPLATVIETEDNVLCEIDERANPYDAKTYENHISIILNGCENWEKIIDLYANLKENSKYGMWFRSYLRGILLLIDKENKGERINNRDLFSHSKWEEYITKMKPFTDKNKNNTENYKKMEEIKKKIVLIKI
jgi:hypothetical protein